MTSLLVHAALGALTLVLFAVTNAYLYRRDWVGSRVTLLEGVYYAVAGISVCAGWFFDAKYVSMYPEQQGWVHFTRQLFDTPAGGSIAQDIIATNAILFPLWTIVDGPRRGLRRPWLYFVMSLFTSFGFSMGLYLAAQERQLRWNAARAER
ncbi:MAG TPA: DUF2834 domain-containing protein [Myxococcota bacterium]|nr:DUF2834 domain-containing protein [Myxococcota bacterium]